MATPLNRFRLPIKDARPIADTPMDGHQAKRLPPAEPLRPPSGAPNVLVFLIDDMGFGASSAFGGPCEMPHAERLGAEGVKYTRFHTTALCSPTRQALLTGRNHHSVNMGAIAEVATSMPGYTGVLPNDCATLAQTLQMNGYATGAFGKWHQTPPWESSPAGPFTRWPTSEGFDKFYGFIGGDTSQWVPNLTDGLKTIDPPRTPEEGYHLSEDIVDQLLGWTTNLGALTPDKPWFAYVAFGATHAPHHAPQEYVDAYRGKFSHGYDAQREITLAKQKELGVIPEDANLTDHNAYIPRWDELSEDDQEVGTRLFEAYAGMATHVDAQVGRVVEYLEAEGQLDNTIIFYILGDNGSSAESGPYGTFNELAYQNNVLMTSADIKEHLDEVGGPDSFTNIPAGWAQAMCSPYQWSKAVASHFGGTRTGMVVRYPKAIPAGENRHQFVHVIDIAPTVLEVAGLPQPDQVNGIDQRPIEGTSFAYSFGDSEAEEQHRTQYFEIVANRAIYHDGWSAVAFHTLPWPDPAFMKDIPALADDRWELYAPGDWTQSVDVADQYPEKLVELKERFLIEGSKYNVLPIDERQRERFNAAIAGRPDLMAGRTTMTMRPGMSRLNENCVLNVKNRSFTVTAKVTVGDDVARGAIIAQGGRFGGWTVYFKDGLLSYAHNWIGMDLFTVRSDSAVGSGEHQIEMRFDYDGGGVGKGGTVTLTCDGEQIGQGRIEKTVPGIFSFDDGTDIGKDSLEPVVGDYGVKGGVFNGSIDTVTLDIAPDVHTDADMMIKARMAKQ